MSRERRKNNNFDYMLKSIHLSDEHGKLVQLR